MGHERVGEARERHVFPLLERVEERLKLRHIWVVADVAAVEELHREIAPRVSIQAGELLRVKLVVEDAAFTPDQVGVEVVGLQAVDDRRGLADTPVPELQDRRGGRGVFVWREDRIRALRGIARDLVDLRVHAQQQRVDRMAARRQERTAAEAAPRVPAILPVPRADAVVVVDLAIVQFPNESRIDDGLGCKELRRVAALEADARLDARLRCYFLHREHFAPVNGQRLLDHHMLAMPRRRDELR